MLQVFLSRPNGGRKAAGRLIGQGEAEWQLDVALTVHDVHSSLSGSFETGWLTYPLVLTVVLLLVLNTENLV